MTDGVAAWERRVAEWKASGQSAAEFSGRQGLAASALRYWASRLKREGASASPRGPVVRVAHVVQGRDRGFGPELARRDGSIVIELLELGARITIDRGVDREMLSAVVLALRGGAAR